MRLVNTTEMKELCKMTNCGIKHWKQVWPQDEKDESTRLPLIWPALKP